MENAGCLRISMETLVESPLTRELALASRWLAMGFSLWLHYSSFQAVLTEPLPSNGHIRHTMFRSLMTFTP
jgi:hypothetical protein